MAAALGDEDAGAVGEGVGVGEEVGVALTATFSPLLQTNFLPLFIQVYLIPADVLIWPIFLQVVPGFTAAVAVERFNERTKQPITMVAAIRFIPPRISTR